MQTTTSTNDEAANEPSDVLVDLERLFMVDYPLSPRRPRAAGSTHQRIRTRFPTPKGGRPVRRSSLIHRLVVIAGFLGSISIASACTNFIITKGASTDGSTFITYAADSHTLYGYLEHTPARTHLPGEMRKVYDWDTGTYLSEIPQVTETYNVTCGISLR